MNSWIREKNYNKMQTIVKKLTFWMSPKGLSIFFSLLLYGSVIPLLWIGFYNYPSADDYSIGSNAHVTWESTHNVFRVLWVGAVRAVDDWLTWMGYFTSNFLMAVPPSSFGEKAYFATAIIMIGMLIASTIYLFYMIMVKGFGCRKNYVTCVTMLALFVSIQCLPTTGSRVEAFYWYAGAANYTLLHAMANFFYGGLIACCIGTGKKKILQISLVSILGFFVGGGNQMTALNVAAVLLVAIVLVSYNKKWHSCKNMIAPTIMFYIGFVLNVSAPGNFVRSSITEGVNPIKAVFMSFYYCLERCLGKWNSWTVVLIFILIAIIAWFMTAEIDYNFSCPGLVIVMAYCLTSAMLTPPIFAVGNADAGRLEALTFFMYVMLASLSIVYVVGWLRKKIYMKKNENDLGISGKTALLGCLVMLLFGMSLCIIGEPHYYTFSSAVVDLSNGSAKEYYAVQCARSALYRECDGVVIVDPLPTRPTLLFFSDITTDQNDWQNRGLSRYLGIEGVVVK